MKKIIDGKVYNTETAQECGEYSNIPYVSDFHYYCETLYKKKTGEFFLFGEGNAASKYCEYVGSASTGGCRIVPLTYDEAVKWVEEHLDADKYIEMFGEPEEDDSKQTLNLYLRKDTINRLKQTAAKEGKTVSEIIEEMIK